MWSSVSAGRRGFDIVVSVGEAKRPPHRCQSVFPSSPIFFFPSHAVITRSCCPSSIAPPHPKVSAPTHAFFCSHLSDTCQLTIRTRRPPVPTPSSACATLEHTRTAVVGIPPHPYGLLSPRMGYGFAPRGPIALYLISPRSLTRTNTSIHIKEHPQCHRSGSIPS